MGSGASAATYDSDEAQAVFQPPRDIIAAASVTDSTMALAEFEERANITKFPFPREGLTFALSARELQRMEETGDALMDAIAGKKVWPKDSSASDEQMVRAWEGPVRVEGGIELSGSAFSLALWIRVLEGVSAGPVAIAAGSNAKGPLELLSFEEQGSGLSVSETSPVAADGQRDVWQLLLLQGEGLRHVSLSARAHRRSWIGSAADLFVASDRRMVRPLARDVRCKQACSRLEVLGGPGVALAEAFVWSRCLTEEERQAVFVRGAITFGSTDLRTLGWSLLAGAVPPEEPRLSKLQEQVAGMEDIADLTCQSVTDGDLPTVLAALLANSTLHTVILAENKITVISGPALLGFLESWAKPAFVLNLQSCKDLGSASFEEELLAVFEGVRGMGIKVLAQGTGLSEKAVQTLANDTLEAQVAAKEREDAIAATQEMTEAFMAHQAQLGAVWSLEEDDTDVFERMQELSSANGIQLLPPAVAAILREAEDVSDGSEGEWMEDEEWMEGERPRRTGETTEAYQLRLEEAKRKYKEYLQKQKEARKVLKEASESHYSEKFQSESPEQRRGSGMLMAHFSCVGGAISLAGLQQHGFFGLQHRQEQPREHRSGALDFQSAVPNGILSIVSATGHCLGKSALHLTIRNPGNGRITVVLSSGTIFEHIDWVHKQNLMVISSVTLQLWPNEQKQVYVDAHCMNSSCACSAGEEMYLTDFYFNDAATIAHQGKIWNYFGEKFTACNKLCRDLTDL